MTIPTGIPAGAARPNRLNELVLLTQRALRREFRQVDGLLVGVALPIILMCAMVGVFGRAIDTGTTLTYVDYVTPAVMLLCAGYGAATTGVGITEDRRLGLTQRFKTLPIAGWGLPASQVVASVLRNVCATALAVVAALILGFSPDADVVDWLLVLAVVVGFVVTIAWWSVVWGLLVKSVQAAGAFSFVVLFLPYVSSAFVPVESLPGFLQGFAEHQPTTPLVELLRGLLLGLPVADGTAWTVVAWLVGGSVVAVPLAAVMFRRRGQE
ncbi:ABC transporter permease [Saccharomonospora xinjiangensis]|uniref:ABC transporter permease n=1 Tax=Saccharomonospora xinjiangensis TaxID=75294 RepID=UPI00106FDABF|nr:ABC transporter permease [Saccharomonospora xinjiangensis]QBQ58433.1 Daunorubicin/doxorubicin resistance ABC transporter permease protein DrrB [Saccharomonospora xinjiangensis]